MKQESNSLAPSHSKPKRSEARAKVKSSAKTNRKPDAPVAGHRTVIVLCGIVLLLLFCFCLILSLRRSLDADELEHLNAAFFMSRGQTMYGTFFENHPPLTAVILQPIVKTFNAPEAMIGWARALMLALTSGVLVVVAKTASPVGGLKASLFSAIWLLSNTFFVHKGIEIRPDVPAALFLALGLLLMTRGGSRSSWMLASGIMMGIAGLFTPKVIYASVGAVIGVCISANGANRLEKIRECFRRLLLIAAGAAIPAGIAALEMARQGVLSGFIRDVIDTSLKMKVDDPAFFRRLFTEMTLRENTVSWILTAVGMAVLFRKRRSLPTGFFEVIACSFLGGIAGLLTIQAPMRQYFLTFLAPAAVAGSAGMALFGDSAAKRMGSAWAAAVTAVLLLLMGMWPISRLFPAEAETMDPQLKIIRRVIQNTSPEDRVMDCWTGLYLTRLPAYRYFYLNSDVQRLLPQEKLEADLLEVLADQRTKVVIQDGHFQKLPRQVLENVQNAFTQDTEFPFLRIRSRH
jgi:hypothetical protein